MVVGRYARIENWVKPVAIRTRKIQADKLVNLRWLVDLISVQRTLKIVKAVRIGLVAEDWGTI